MLSRCQGHVTRDALKTLLKFGEAAVLRFSTRPSSETSESSAIGFLTEIISFGLSDHYLLWQVGQK
jgi:hypothetical protein